MQSIVRAACTVSIVMLPTISPARAVAQHCYNLRVVLDPPEPSEAESVTLAVRVTCASSCYHECVIHSYWVGPSELQIEFFIEISRGFCLAVLTDVSSEVVLGALERGDYVVRVTEYWNWERSFFDCEFMPNIMDEREFEFTVYSRGDLNRDGQVDLVDYYLFQGCISGPNVQPPPECTWVDLDQDGGVDFRDFAILQREFRG